MRVPAPPLKSTGLARTLARIRALGQLGLAPEFAVPEMTGLMARGLNTMTQPAVLVIDGEAAKLRAQEFVVWTGADPMVRELRQLLAIGVWPGPKGTPSLHDVMARRENRHVFAATLWGEGCEDEGPWGDLWRARGIQQGLQAVFFAASGMTAVALMSRGAGAPAFSSGEIAFAEACVPAISEAIDGLAEAEPYDMSLAETQLLIEADGTAGAMGYGVAEILRDMGGGGSGAVETMVKKIETLAAKLPKERAHDGDPFLHLRRSQAASRDTSPTLQPIVIAENAFGHFSVRFSPLAVGGVVAAIHRKVPRALLAARGAALAGVPARELELAVALARRKTLDGAAATLGVSLSSVKTLLDRLVARTGAGNRGDAMAALIKEGRTASW